MENLNILIATNYSTDSREKNFTNKIREHIQTNDNYMAETIKIVESFRELTRALKQNKYHAVLLTETLAGEKIEIRHLKSISRYKGLHVIMLLPEETLPTEKGLQLYENGYYDCVYTHKITMRILDMLIKFGRTPSQAREYYELTPKEKEQKEESTQFLNTVASTGLSEKIRKQQLNSSSNSVLGENEIPSQPLTSAIEGFAANMQSIPTDTPISYISHPHLPDSKIGTVEAVVAYVINEDTAVIQLKRKPEIPFTDINFAGTEVNVPYLRIYNQQPATAPPPFQTYPWTMQHCQPFSNVQAYEQPYQPDKKKNKKRTFFHRN